MPKYEVAFTQAGTFKQGDVVTDDEIKKAGFDPEFWLGNGAIKPVEEAKPAAPAAAKTLKPAAPAAATPAKPSAVTPPAA
jgi:hypothetical protein